MPAKVRDVESALTQKGFQEAPNRDHRYFFFYVDGKKTRVNTKISRSDSEIHDRNCSLMARQMKLTNRQFRDFVDCHLGLQEYTRLLTQNGHVKPAPRGEERERPSG